MADEKLSSFLNVNGLDLPCPKDGFKYITSQAVSDGRDSNNAYAGQLIGRPIVKFDSLEWVGLYPEQWKAIKQALKPFVVPVTYIDEDTGKVITRDFYHGDTTAEPLLVDKNTHKVIRYRSCKVNLVDCGYDD